ncbi:MAG: ATP synthase F1 subunit delta [Bacteroidales bacterium]|jgi:F-type H+-transporting ATPase subunit delta|nr:ATP synthase F1 subunit delta [Bacteroidales bacterium]
MNTGIISSRYARALLKYTNETGNGELVCSQVLAIERAIRESEDLRRILDDPVAVPNKEKISLFQAVLGNITMADELVRFFKLILRHERIEYIKLILHSFVNMYLKSRKILMAKLVTTVTSHDLEEKLENLVKEKTGYEIILETKVDPGIIGGFIFTVDDYMVDASIYHQLEVIRHQFVEKNRRIV